MSRLNVPVVCAACGQEFVHAGALGQHQRACGQETPATLRKRRQRAREGAGNRTPRPDLNPEWRDHAACVDHPVELWYSSPDTDRSTNGRPRAKTPAEKAAIAICDTCPSKAPCLRYALDAKEPAGIFGGLTEPERRALTRRRGAAS